MVDDDHPGPATEEASVEASVEASERAAEGWKGGRARRVRPRTRSQMEADRERIAPLFAYLEAHCIPAMTPVRRAAMRRGARPMTRSQLHYLKAGRVRIPEHFITDVCREIGQSVDVVMNWRAASLEVPPALAPVTSTEAAVAVDRQAS